MPANAAGSCLQRSSWPLPHIKPGASRHRRESMAQSLPADPPLAANAAKKGIEPVATGGRVLALFGQNTRNTSLFVPPKAVRATWWGPPTALGLQTPCAVEPMATYPTVFPQAVNNPRTCATGSSRIIIFMRFYRTCPAAPPCLFPLRLSDRIRRCKAVAVVVAWPRASRPSHRA